MPWFKKLSQMYVLYGLYHVTVSFDNLFLGIQLYTIKVNLFYYTE